MDSDCKELCDALGRAIVGRDFAAVHALLAPWLRAALGPGEIERLLDAQSEGLAHPPASWVAGEGLADLEELRRPDPFGPPTQALPPEITPASFRGWLHVQLVPDPAVHEEQNVCYDVWLVAVEHEGSCLVGYLEPWEAT
jgi:hypothetical protein